MSGDTHLQPRYVRYDPNTSHEHQMAEKHSSASRGSDKRREPRWQSVTVDCVLYSYCAPGFMDRIWRTTLKMPQSPQRSMVRVARSSSRTKSPARDTAGARSGSALARAASFRAKIRPEAEARAEEFAESIVKSVKVLKNSSVQKQYSPFSSDVHVLPVQRGWAAWPLCWWGLAPAWPSFWDVESVKRF